MGLAKVARSFVQKISLQKILTNFCSNNNKQLFDSFKMIDQLNRRLQNLQKKQLELIQISSQIEAKLSYQINVFQEIVKKQNETNIYVQRRLPKPYSFKQLLSTLAQITFNITMICGCYFLLYLIVLIQMDKRKTGSK